mgnify:FL=1
MMSILKNLPPFISGAICGLILFQSVIVAPSINNLLQPADASTYLRYIWPKFFIIISVLSIFSILIIYSLNSNQSFAKIASILTLIFMLVCYFIIPTMNNARDSANDSLFFILHSVSIGLTIITLILNLLLFIKWKF